MYSWCVARKYNGRVHAPLLTLLKVKHSNLKFSHWSPRPPRLLVSRTIQENPRRGYGMIIARILRGALKIRYIVLGGAVGGGLTLQNVSYKLYITNCEINIEKLQNVNSQKNT